MWSCHIHRDRSSLGNELEHNLRFANSIFDRQHDSIQQCGRRNVPVVGIYCNLWVVQLFTFIA